MSRGCCQEMANINHNLPGVRLTIARHIDGNFIMVTTLKWQLWNYITQWDERLEARMRNGWIVLNVPPPDGMINVPSHRGNRSFVMVLWRFSLFCCNLNCWGQNNQGTSENTEGSASYYKFQCSLHYILIIATKDVEKCKRISQRNT